MKPKVFVSGSRGNWKACFKIGVQTFHICETSTRFEAEWYCKCLRHAFRNMEAGHETKPRSV